MRINKNIHLYFDANAELDKSPFADKEIEQNASTKEPLQLIAVQGQKDEAHFTYDEFLQNTKRINQNAAAFAKKILRAENPQGNYIYSPLSTWLCYELFLGGCSGQVKQRLQSELESVASFDSKKDKLATIYSLLQRYDGDNSSTKISNFLFIQKDWDFADSFLAYASYFKALLLKMNLADEPEAVTKAINKLIADHSFDIIPKFYKQVLDSNIMSILMNIVALDAAWSERFQEENTKKDIFTLADGSEVKVDMMRQTVSHDMSYAKDEFGEYLLKPYQSGERMLLMLPAAGKRPQDILQHWLDSDYDRDFLQGKEVSLSLPKFAFETTHPLKEIFSKLGLEILFDAAYGRDMQGFLQNQTMCVDDSKQVARIEVFEKGTRAAAVTSIEMRLTAMPMAEEHIEINFDRPFAFIICDPYVELFRGVVMDPRE